MKQVLMLDAMEYFLICLLRYPTANNFQFLNSKISISNAQQKDVVDMLHNRGIKNWSNGVPYMTIILEYFQHLLTGNFGSSAIGTLAGSEATSSGSETFNERYRELFLRLAVEYWIDCATVIRYEHHKVVHYRNIFTSGMSNMHKAGNSYGMYRHSIDLVVTK